MCLAVGRKGEMVAHVVDGLAVPERVRFELGECPAGERFVGAHHLKYTRHLHAHEAARGRDGVGFIEHEIAKRARIEGDDHGAFGCRFRINFSRGVQDCGAHVRWRAQQRDDIGRESVSFLRARLLELRQALGDLDPALRSRRVRRASRRRL